MATERRTSEADEGIAPWTSLEQRRATAFIVAGALLLGFVASNGVEAFTATTPPTWVNTMFVSPALVAASLGLLGLYPTLAERAPRLALVSAAVVTVAGTAAIALFVVTAGNGLVAGVQLPFLPVYLLTLLATVLGFVLFGVAGIRTRTPSRRVGLLLLGPPAVNVVMFATAPMNPPRWTTFLISALWTGAMLAVGLALRSSPDRPDRTEPSVDSAAGE